MIYFDRFGKFKAYFKLSSIPGGGLRSIYMGALTLFFALHKPFTDSELLRIPFSLGSCIKIAVLE